MTISCIFECIQIRLRCKLEIILRRDNLPKMEEERKAFKKALNLKAYILREK